MPAHFLVLVPYPASAGAPPPPPPGLTGPCDYKVTWRPLPVAMAADRGYADAALEDLAVMAAAQNEDSGIFNAVIVDSLGDGGVAALRSVLHLLVVGSGKVAALHALTLGTRFSFLVHSRAAAMCLRSELRQWRIEAHCASVRVVEPDAGALRDAALRCATDDGAEVLILGSSAYAPFAADLAELLDIPLISPLPLACEIAAALLAAGLSHSRGAAPAPRVIKLPVLDAMARAMREAG